LGNFLIFLFFFSRVLLLRILYFLGFVVHRYKEHTSFVSQQFWKLVGADGNNKGFIFVWEREGLSVHIFDESVVQVFILFFYF